MVEQIMSLAEYKFTIYQPGLLYLCLGLGCLVTIINFNTYGVPFGHMVAVRWGKNFRLVIWLQLSKGIEFRRLITGYDAVITVVIASKRAVGCINDLVIWLQLLPKFSFGWLCGYGHHKIFQLVQFFSQCAYYGYNLVIYSFFDAMKIRCGSVFWCYLLFACRCCSPLRDLFHTILNQKENNVP